jgi:hypothetical protein
MSNACSGVIFIDRSTRMVRMRATLALLACAAGAMLDGERRPIDAFAVPGVRAPTIGASLHAQLKPSLPGAAVFLC